jgi:ubiquinone/menaquinone biosynthesis C-methylase UbiE
MSLTTSDDVQETLSRPRLHDTWIETYRGAENEPFMEMAFNEIVRWLRQREKGQDHTAADRWLLDAGCGTGKHSVRLVKRGFRVHAVDFSEHVLKQAREYAFEQSHVRQVSPATLQFGRENLLALSFPDASFDYVLCWGVLMHIQEISKAVHQLARVVRPGGWIVIGENNVHSLEWTLYRLFRRSGSRSIRLTPAGLESSWEHDAGKIFVRQQSIPWLTQAFATEGLSLERRIARQFTEVYTKLPWRSARRLVHVFNNAYFKHVGLPGPASGNLLFFRKSASITE